MDTNIETAQDEPTSTDDHRLQKKRVNDIDELRKMSVDPFPSQWQITHTLSQARQLLESVQRSNGNQHAYTEVVRVAGRITARRNMGRMVFIDLKSNGTRLQVQLRFDILGESINLEKFLDIGDFLGVEGPLFRTRRGEPTVEVRSLTILTKAIRSLPDKWSGLKDPEVRRRQRYLDLIANDKAMQNAKIRSAILRATREFMESSGFIEVETPILVPVAAGATARPFITRHNALGKDLYLRIATELPLKKLIIGGMEKVFEIGRVFRNEGIDHNHNPEFTTIEAYQAYTSYNEMMELVESLVYNVALKVISTPVIQNPVTQDTVDLTPPWKRISLIDEVIKQTGINLLNYTSATDLARKMQSVGIYTSKDASLQSLMDKVISASIEPHLIEPCFLVDYPVAMSPLAKKCETIPSLAQRFEGFLFGTEIANSFTELNDPIDQRERMEEQEKRRLEYTEDDTDRLDEDFLNALEYGMPPTGGFGLGIDRLSRIIAGETTIREIVIFPTMR